LIAATRRLLDDHLPGELTIRAIATEARVNSGLVHRHFGSKAALFGAVITEIRTEYVSQLTPEMSLLDQLFAPIEWIVRTPLVGRLLIWAASEGTDPAAFGLDHQLITRAATLMEASGVDDPQLVIAQQLAAALGWNAFETALMHGLHQDPAAVDEARDQFLSHARQSLHDHISHAAPRGERSNEEPKFISRDAAN
jgi:AcrR family transcriptional regulator